MTRIRFLVGLFTILLLSQALRQALAGPPRATDFEPIEKAYANFSLKGKLKQVVFVPKRDTFKDYQLDFRRRGDESRAIRRPHDPKKRWEIVVVSSPGISFDVKKLADGKEELRYAAVGIEGQEQLEEGMPEKWITAAPYGYLAPLSEILTERRIEWGEESKIADDPNGVRLKVVRLRPKSRDRDDDFDYLDGTMEFRIKPVWHLTKVQLRTHWKSGSKLADQAAGKWVDDTTVEYGPPANGIPVPKRVQHSFLDNGKPTVTWTLDVDRIEFGVCKEDDFTIEAAGIKSLPTGGVK